MLHRPYVQARHKHNLIFRHKIALFPQSMNWVSIEVAKVMKKAKSSWIEKTSTFQFYWRIGANGTKSQGITKTIALCSPHSYLRVHIKSGAKLCKMTIEIGETVIIDWHPHQQSKSLSYYERRCVTELIFVRLIDCQTQRLSNIIWLVNFPVSINWLGRLFNCN